MTRGDGRTGGEAAGDGIVALVDARETALFGSKAVGLGDALRAGLPVPPGVALSGPVVEAVATGDQAIIDEVVAAVRNLDAPLAVRSSAADEDGADASFAGQHVTVLNVPSVDELLPALKEVWWSANSDSAFSYRQRVGVLVRPSIGVVVQSLLEPESAGVMFTRNPVTGADERVVEAAWGLGEAVVAGLVIPDHFRIDRAGQVLEATTGRKHVAVRPLPDGGTREEPVPVDRREEPCLDTEQLAALSNLAATCEQIYGPGRDVEWAFAGGDLYLLQCRAVTTTAGRPGSGGRPDPGQVPGQDRADALRPVQLFAELDDEERLQVARLFKERRFAAGETVIREGTGGAAFFLIDAGEAVVVVGGEERATLRPGDYFGEIALVDSGPRSATVVAATDLVCSGITYWDFRPLVEANGRIGWKLLESMARKLRQAERRDQAPAVAGPA